MVKFLEFLTKGPSQTKKIGAILAKDILKTEFQKTAFVMGLEGELGSGKTTFLQGFAKGLKIKEKILSPTFTIIKKFPIFNSQFSNFFHIDCYRLKKEKELLALGFKEIISDPRNIVAIEWADKAKKTLPKKVILLKFKFLNKNIRKITITI